MNARDFFNLVVKMRKAQRDYFRTRSQHSLNESKQLEKLVDAEIKRVAELYFPKPVLMKDRIFPELLMEL